MSARQQFPQIADGAVRVLDLFADIGAPAPEMTVHEWAEAKRVLGEGQGKFQGQRWRTDRAPYLQRPMECAGLDHPCRMVAIAGSAQSGKTAVAENTLGHLIDHHPRPAIVLTPTLEMRGKWAADKFDPMVAACPDLRAKVAAQRSTAGASSASKKRFRGGQLYFIAAGSSGQLQMITAGYLVADEIAELEVEAGERGDPLDQAEQRLSSYGDEAKRLYISTTGQEGTCRITALVQAGTLERWYVPCPHCGDFHVLAFEAMTEHEGRACFGCPSCGGLIEQHHKAEMIRAGAYVPTYFDRDPACADDENPAENPANPRPPAHFPAADLPRWQSRPTLGRYPSFHFWQAYSLFRPWADVWADWSRAQGDPLKLKVFVQQVLAQPYAEEGNAPKYSRLVEAAKTQSLPRGQVPAWAPMLALGVDVQGDRLKWVALAAGPGHRFAVIDHGDIPGRPENPETWNALREFILTARYQGSDIQPLTFDRIAIDSGFETAMVYAFASGNPLVRAVDGRADPQHPPLGTGKKRMAKVRGVRRASATLYPVGTYGLKKRVYFGLSAWMEGVEAGGGLPPGALVLHRDVDDAFAKEITAETLDPKKTVKGQPTWKKREFQANDYLDCTVYALAVLWEYGADRLDETGWAAFTAARAKDPVAEAEPAPLFDDRAEAVIAGASKPAVARAEGDTPARNPGLARTRPAWMDALTKANQS